LQKISSRGRIFGSVVDETWIIMPELINIKIPESIIGQEAIDKLGELVTRFGASRVLVVTDAGIMKAGIIEKVKASLVKAGHAFDVYPDCETEPTISSIMDLVEKARGGKHGMLVAVGGGSVMDAVKVASQLIPNEDLTVYDLLSGKEVKQVTAKVLVPTTAGTGSEWSNVAVIYDNKEDKEENTTKIYISRHNFADAAIIDPGLTMTLPQSTTAETGMDALTHAIEAYTSRKSNVMSDMFAGTAIKLIARYLRNAFHQGASNPEARYNMSLAASLAMSAVAMSSVGMAHLTNVPLGQKAKISHGTACLLMLPHVMKFNLAANPSKYAQIAGMMGETIEGLNTITAAGKAVEAVRKLARDIGMKQDLIGSNINDADIESMVKSVHTRKGPPINSVNPRDVTPEDTRMMYIQAIRGTQ
jgi:alcohol dehydrogenase